MNVGSLSSARRWFIFVWIIAILPHGAAFSEEPTLVEFDIAAQDLGDALTEFGVQSGTEVYFVSADVASVQAPRIEGKYSAIDVIQQLLGSSGVEYFIDGNGTLLVGTAYTAVNTSDERGASDSKNLTGPTPVLMAQNQTSQTQTTSSQSDEGGTSIVTGKVTDARTGANLKGAKVTIEETGQWTSTNDLGEFRFVNVSTGSATLTVSYLGYAGQSAVVGVRGEEASQNFTLRGGSEMEEIVVFGQRSARALALNQERTADNFKTVIAADLLGNFNGTTISEALRRAPGVAFEPSESTGDGANIIIRGLEPDLNQITLNGLRLPEGSGVGRSADLSGILTESIESVTINKTLLPSQDSNGAGGLVEIETKSPLDRPRRFANFGAEYGERGNSFGNDLLLSTTASGRFGASEDFGASLSLQYRDREVDRLSYETGFSRTRGGLGRFLPADVASASLVPALRSFPFEDGLSELYPSGSTVRSSTVNDENLSATASLQKKIGNHTDLRLDFTLNEIETETFTNTTTALVQGTGYLLLPIDELGGEERLALISEDFFFRRSGSSLFPGVNLTIGRQASWVPTFESETQSLSFRGKTTLDDSTFSYNVGYAKGDTRTPSSYEIQVGADPRGSQLDIDFLTDEVRAVTVDGGLVSPFLGVGPNDESFVLPALTADGFSFFNEVDNLPLGAFNNTGRFGARGSNERVSFDGAFRKSFPGSVFDYVEVGLFAERSEFESLGVVTSQSYSAPADVLLSELGFSFVPGSLNRIGIPAGLLDLSQDGVESFALNVDNLAAQSLLAINESDDQTRRRTVQTDENNLSGYVEARLDFGRLEIIGGVRIDQTKVDSSFFVSPFLRNADGSFSPTFRDDFGQVVDGSAKQTDVLPRVIANYRWSENVVFRGGYYSTASRPRVQTLNAGLSGATLDLRPVFGPNGDQPTLRLSQGNPDLKPAFTHNFDASWEWYTDSIGVVKVSGYYKKIENSLTSTFTEGGIEVIPPGVVLPDAPGFSDLPDNVFVSVTVPVNGDENDEIWGGEVSIERQFDFLPGWWSDFGFYGNYTYADSSRDVEIRDFSFPDGTFVLEGVPFTGAPKHSGTASITYSNHGWDANFSYSRQSRRLRSLGRNGLDSYAEEIETLDFRIEYLTQIQGVDVRFYVRGIDLLTDDDETYLRNSIGGEDGTPKYFTGASYFGGRYFLLGGSTSF